MGTNYYAVKVKPSISEPIHIGKSSMGWLFLFQSHNETWSDPPVIWNTYEQVMEWLKKYTVDTHEYVILDEYDEVIDYDDFKKYVDYKQKDKHCLDNPENFYYCRNVNGYRFSDSDFS